MCGEPCGKMMYLFVWMQACGKVVKYVAGQVAAIHKGLDGKNVDAVLTEFGIRFHRVVYEHLQQFTYNSIGTLYLV